eukprot:683624-Lingulodinium_polyedra.AAC.1
MPYLKRLQSFLQWKMNMLAFSEASLQAYAQLQVDVTMKKAPILAKMVDSAFSLPFAGTVQFTRQPPSIRIATFTD